MNKEKAIFAAGCFWGVQDYFDQIPGVTKTSVGYSGGFVDEPSYEEVCTDKTGHAEAILIEFDPKKVSYETLLKHFFLMHDPTQYLRQGPDVGSQYRSAIFFLNENQRDIAEKYIDSIKPSYDKDIVTEVTPATEFFDAEDYHQKFVQKTGRGACHIPYKPLD